MSHSFDNKIGEKACNREEMQVSAENEEREIIGLEISPKKAQVIPSCKLIFPLMEVEVISEKLIKLTAVFNWKIYFPVTGAILFSLKNWILVNVWLLSPM